LIGSTPHKKLAFIARHRAHEVRFVDDPVSASSRVAVDDRRARLNMGPDRHGCEELSTLLAMQVSEKIREVPIAEELVALRVVEKRGSEMLMQRMFVT